MGHVSLVTQPGTRAVRPLVLVFALAASLQVLRARPAQSLRSL